MKISALSQPSRLFCNLRLGFRWRCCIHEDVIHLAMISSREVHQKPSTGMIKAISHSRDVVGVQVTKERRRAKAGQIYGRF